MKKIILILLFATFLQSCETIAWLTRYHTANVIAAGGKAGIGGSDAGESWEDPVGGFVGIETKVHEFSENSSLKTGINLSFQGADYTDSYDIEPYGIYSLKSVSTDNEFSGTVTTRYLNIPLLYNYQWDCGFFAEAGLQPGYLLRARDKYEGGDSYDYKNQMKGFELGLPVGFGYQINNQWSVGTRAIWGLTNNSDSGSGDKDHNYLITGTISYNIGSLFDNNK